MTTLSDLKKYKTQRPIEVDPNKNSRFNKHGEDIIAKAEANKKEFNAKMHGVYKEILSRPLIYQKIKQ